VKAGVQVVICHPKLVETGLDLLDFPTLIFYQTGYSLHTLRQASRRSWRIGQKLPVRVLFFFYKGTFQERCVQHMGRKCLTAMAMEGKFSGEGLNAMGDEDMMTSLARELVEQGGVGESANQIWRDLRTQRELLLGNSSPVVSVVDSVNETEQLEQMFSTSVNETAIAVTPVVVVVAAPEPLVGPVFGGLLQFVVQTAKKKRNSAAHEIVESSQMLLFA
jgi:hypothetical protein